MAYSDRLMCEGGASLVGATIPRNLMGFLDAFKAAHFQAVHAAPEPARRN